jgi:hypothetical protein
MTDLRAAQPEGRNGSLRTVAVALDNWGLAPGMLRGRPAAHANFDPLPFDAASARAFGRVAAWSGRKPVARAYDALIAATALSRGLSIYTCNPDDFAASMASKSWPSPLGSSQPCSSLPGAIYVI